MIPLQDVKALTWSQLVGEPTKMNMGSCSGFKMGPGRPEGTQTAALEGGPVTTRGKLEQAETNLIYEGQTYKMGLNSSQPPQKTHYYLFWIWAAVTLILSLPCMLKCLTSNMVWSNNGALFLYVPLHRKAGMLKHEGNLSLWLKRCFDVWKSIISFCLKPHQ